MITSWENEAKMLAFRVVAALQRSGHAATCSGGTIYFRSATDSLCAQAPLRWFFGQSVSIKDAAALMLDITRDEVQRGRTEDADKAAAVLSKTGAPE